MYLHFLQANYYFLLKCEIILREREALHPQDVLDNLANFSDCFINNWHSCLYTLDVVLVNLINYFRLLFDHMRWNEHFCEHLSVQIFSDDFTRKIITHNFPYTFFQVRTQATILICFNAKIFNNCEEGKCFSSKYYIFLEYKILLSRKIHSKEFSAWNALLHMLTFDCIN